MLRPIIFLSSSRRRITRSRSRPRGAPGGRPRASTRVHMASIVNFTLLRQFPKIFFNKSCLYHLKQIFGSKEDLWLYMTIYFGTVEQNIQDSISPLLCCFLSRRDVLSATRSIPQPLARRPGQPTRPPPTRSAS
jgi:hypothetical protein